jgi:hypothetical protein
MPRQIDLSILTPSVPSRIATHLLPLCGRIGSQIAYCPAVEHLVLLDNKRRTVGEKRNSLVELARGRFVAFVDDDDDVSRDYVGLLVGAIRDNPDVDVITFRQVTQLGDGGTFTVDFHLGAKNEQAHRAGPSVADPYADIQRPPYHVCAWQRQIAVTAKFSAENFGEDFHWCEQACILAKTEHHIPRVLHYYGFGEVPSETQ